MKPLFISAVVTFSGKTALALGIGLKLQAAGHKVGYYKPISTQPFFVEGNMADEDASFVQRVLNLDTPPWELSSVIIDEALFERILDGQEKRNFGVEINERLKEIGKDKDVLLIEGGSSMREGYTIGLSTPMLADVLDLPTLGVVRYRDGLMLMDDVLALHYRMGKHLMGVVINSVPTEAYDQIKNQAVPYLEKRGVKIYGVLPFERGLMSISVDEMLKALNGKIITGEDKRDVMVENLSVGAMTVESALPRFRRTLHKAVITGGDRADIQAAALETSTTALVLTGNLHPNSSVVKRAEELGVAVLMVPGSTMETVETLEKVFGKTRLNQPEKLARYTDLLDKHLDFARLFADMGV
jgi:BioD-like phosphotransacetylase family protein